MTEIVGNVLLVDVVREAALAQDIGSLYAGVLPALRSLAGASTAQVVARTTEGPVVAYSDGTALPPEPVEVPGGDVPVPASWSALGVTRVLAQPLAGRCGTLLVAWTEHAPDTDPVLEAALDTFTAATVRLETARELADLSQRVDNAQHLASMGDYDWHIPTDTNRWSDQLYRIYGHEPQSFNASYERFLSAIHPDDRERIQALHQQAYATGEPYQMIERIVRPDGETRYLSSNGEVIMDAQGTPVRMRGTCIDITERVLAERERERVDGQFRGLVESAPQAILVFGAEGRVLLGNPRAAELLGADPTGRHVGEILPGGHETGQAVPAVRLDGEDLVLDVVRTGLSQDDGEPRTAVFLSDAAPRLEREAMAERLGEVHQRRRQALEINDNVVQGLTSALYALDQDDGPSAHSYLSRTLGAARDMMDDLLEPSGQNLRPGDLVRSTATAIGPARTVLPEEEPSGPPAPAHRILIVDDAEDIRMLLRMKLSAQSSYDVVGEAVDGVDAVDQARELQPHLVLLDMAMPRMDGLQALPLIRDAVPDVRVIVLSGFNQGTLEQEALAAGADRYVVKGAPMSELMELIASVLDAA
ncbi:response regulator [Marmoricola sp. RAF53]|uniref:response regulator n=1 Tax=Marmoricola sp. RAF53 TaxID=3233059 RepID=UPI003F9E0101